MNKLAVIIPFYLREEITSLCFENISEQAKRIGFDVYAVGDDDKLCRKYDIYHIYAPNDFLSNKLNTAYQYIKDSYDGVIGIGSDNFVSDSVFELYKEMDLSTPFFTGFTDIHIYSVKLKKLAHNFPYTMNGNLIAVGRLITKSALQMLGYAPYPEYHKKGIDGVSKLKMINLGFKEVAIDYANHFILDVKHELNISSNDIIYTGKEDNLNKLPKNLLSLKPKSNTQILFKMENKDKIEVIYLEDSSGMAKGTIKKLPTNLAKELINLGVVAINVVEIKEEAPAPAPKKRGRK